MYYPNANRVQQFQANFLRKMAADDKNPLGFAPSPFGNPAANAVIDPYNIQAETIRQRMQELGDAQMGIQGLTQPGPTVERTKAYDRYNKAVAAHGGDLPSAQEYEKQYLSEKDAAARRERIKQLLKAYAPYVGGGAALGALLGGGIGYRSGNTLAGGLLGLGGGALLGAAGKYAYDKYRAGQQANRAAVG